MAISPTRRGYRRSTVLSAPRPGFSMRTAQASSAAPAAQPWLRGKGEAERVALELPALAYLIRMFPQTSETFIANEVLELEWLGGRIRIFSYRRPREDVNHECVRMIRSPVRYLPDPLYLHARELARSAWTVRRSDPARFRRALGYALRHSVRERDADIWRRFLQAACLASILEGSDIEHLHAHFAHQNTQVAMLASMMTGIPFSFTAHAKDIYTAKPRHLRAKIRAADFVVTCTRANQEYLRRVADPDRRARIHVRYHGTNVAKFTPSAQTPKDDPPVILSAGRLFAKKGFPYLLRACSVLKRRGLPFRCVIVGYGPERDALEREVARLGLQGAVAFRGRMTQEEL